MQRVIGLMYYHQIIKNIYYMDEKRKESCIQIYLKYLNEKIE